jgi:hypothetical protein
MLPEKGSMNIRSYVSGAAATLFVLIGSASMAQQGTTTGPATGADVGPNTATQKENPAIPPEQARGTGQSTGTVSTGGAVGAGGACRKVLAFTAR